MDKLKQDAIKKGLCKEYNDNWQGETIADLCNMYKKGIHFCIEKNYPNLDYITKHYRGKTEEYGVYINEIFSTYVSQDIYIINGGSIGKIRNNEFNVTKIYLRHTSVLTLNCIDYSITYVDMYDNSEISLNISDKARVIINQYGGVINGDISKARIKYHTICQ
jgi:hypothetical protein